MQKQMNSAKTWTLAVLSAIVVVATFIIALNVVVDAYGLLRTDFTRQFQVPNMNAVKVKFLLRNRQKYDSFLFGSSRPEKIDPRHIPGGRFYDLTYPIGVPQEHLANLKFLLKSGFVIRNVMVGLDDFSYRFDPLERQSDLALQPHYGVSGKDPRTFYAEYFLKLRKIGSHVKEYVKHNYTSSTSSERTRYRYDLFDTGQMVCPTCDADIEKNREGHIRSSLFLQPVIKVQGENFEPAMQALREMVELTRKNNITLTVFINPLHHFTYLDAPLDQFARFKRELAAITPYWDFSGLNAVTTDNYNYYETSHYRPFVGDMMLKVMFGNPETKVPAGFGRYVTKENVDDHLQRLCLELTSRKNLSAGTLNAAFAEACLQPVVTASGR